MIQLMSNMFFEFLASVSTADLSSLSLSYQRLPLITLQIKLTEDTAIALLQINEIR